MKTYLFSFFLVYVILVPISHRFCRAYDNEFTHQAINQEAVGKSGLDMKLKIGLGFKGGSSQKIKGKETWKWIRDGGKEEDEPHWRCLSAFSGYDGLWGRMLRSGGGGSWIGHSLAERRREASWYAFQREALERDGKRVTEIKTKPLGRVERGLYSSSGFHHLIKQFPGQNQCHRMSGQFFKIVALVKCPCLRCCAVQQNCDKRHQPARCMTVG